MEFGSPKTSGVEVTEPTLVGAISQACTASQFEEAEYAYWCEQIREVPRPHRKQWEFCYILQTLSERHMLADGRKAIGFGVGAEPLTAVFASRGVEVVATDLAYNEASKRGWTETNQHAANLVELNQRGICPPEQFKSRVTFRAMDMTKIPADLHGFDFCWSACALEHLGSLDAGARFVQRSLDLLRPGGVAVHTTEYNVQSDFCTLRHGATVLYRRRDIVRLADRLRTKGARIRLNFNAGSGALDRYVDAPPYSDDRHLKLRLGRYVTTSFGLVIDKA